MRYCNISDAQFAEKLDAIDAKLAHEHAAALQDARKKHDMVLQSAERAREDLQRQVELGQLRRREEEARLREMERREAQELREMEHRRRMEELERVEKEKRRVIEVERAEREKREKLKALEVEERMGRERVEEERVERERRQREAEKVAAQRAAQPPSTTQPSTAIVTTQPPPATTTATSLQSAAKPAVLPAAAQQSTPLCDWAALEAEHKAYLQLHQKLKQMRKHMTTLYKEAKRTKQATGVANPPLEEMPDMRRQIDKNLGQLTSDTKKNQQIRQGLRDLLRRAWSNMAVALDAREFILRPQEPWPTTPNTNTQVSGLFIYLVNMLVKYAMKQLPIAATTTAYNAIDPIGILVSFALSVSDFRIHGNHFADILLAKYHRRCPVLFGIYGSESTEQGRLRLGWPREIDGTWAPLQEHLDNTTGYAIGFAAVVLRDYSRMKGETSALPPWHFWRSLAALVNLPSLSSSSATPP